jgi:feruloyl esterase
LLSAQRFPDDFDGIVAGAPAFDFTGTMLMYYWTSHVMDGFTFSAEKLDFLAGQVYARCDGIDGLQDGLITDPRRCDFDPAKHLPRCVGPGNGSDCFTQEEISRLVDIYKGPQVNGRSIYPGAPPGAEVRGLLIDPDERVVRSASGWVPWIVNPAGPTIQEIMVSSYLKYLAFEKDDPDYDWRDYSIDPLPAGLDQATPQLLDVKSTDLSRFSARGGKMVTYFGWADTAINPMPIVTYYESLQGAMNQDPHDFYRLFMVPGMFHCGGGAGADRMDVMTPVIDWVEAGKPPDSIFGDHFSDGVVEFSRPQCPYPQVARYKGEGETSASSSFECVAPQ